MPNANNASIIRPPKIVMSPPPGERPRLQMVTIRMDGPVNVNLHLKSGWGALTLYEVPDLVEIVMGTSALGWFREWLKKTGRDDSEMVATFESLEATVYHNRSLPPDVVVFLSYRTRP